MPLTIDELKKLKIDFVVGCELKEGQDRENLTKQDKKHIRIIGILKLSKEGNMPLLLNNHFIEIFKYDKENRIGYYLIRIIKRKEKKKYADC